MSERLFGTDGVRGVANQELTATLAMQLAAAAGYWIRHHPQQANREGRPFVVTGRDTRLSCDMLEAALAAGLTSMGVDVVQVGVIPTPGVSQITLSRGASAGIVISASHNPYADNGIKFFGANGKKLPDSVEDEITNVLSHLDAYERPIAGDIGRILSTKEPVSDYVVKVKETVSAFGATPLKGLRLTMDCANGAASELAPQIFRELGAELDVLFNAPDGVNINLNCGSLKTDTMRQRVKETGANAGLAFDGDADRVMLADENGELVNGDRMMAIIALHLHAAKQLAGDVVIATIMSNVGLEKALEPAGVRLCRTAVGDRYVAEGMERFGAVVGGEQSGHILLPNITPTGDGMVTALQVLAIMHETGKSLSELASVVQDYPQKLKSVRVKNLAGWKNDPVLQAAISKAQTRFENPEWLSVRASGTEPLIRVMAQGTDAATVEEVVEELSNIAIERLV